MPRRASAPPAGPLAATRSIIVSDLRPESLSRLARRGIRAADATQGTLGPPIVRLQLPRGMSVAAAQSLLRKVDSGANAASDTYYYVQDVTGETKPAVTPVCPARGCDPRTLVGWSEPDDDEDDLCVSSPTIGLIDTRVDPSHPALVGQDVEVLAPTGSGSDPDHGSAIAALLVGKAADAPGLLPRAKLLAVDAFSRAPAANDRSDVLSLVMAIEALTARGVKVINLSLAGPANPLLQRAIDVASAAGVIIVAAAGNEGPAAGPAYPAAYSGVIAVTAVDRNLAVYRRANRGDYVDIAAPGVEVPVTSGDKGVTLRSGTSYAAPYVAATAAALSLGRSAATVRALLDGAARDLGPPGRDPTFGWGLLQASAVCIKNPAPAEMPVQARADGTGSPPPAPESIHSTE